MEQQINDKAEAVFKLQEAVEEIDKRNPSGRMERLKMLQDRCLAVYALNKANAELNEILKG